MYKTQAKQVNSIFLKHFNDLMSISDVCALKSKIKEIVDQSAINQMDKRKIAFDISSLETTCSLQFYLTNSMLKYGGMGIR